MKVYIIAYEPFPNGMAATNRIKCYAKALRYAGVDCEVILYNRTEVYGKKPKNIEGCGIYDGIPFKYIGGTPLRNWNPLVRKILDCIDKRKTIAYLNSNLKSGDLVFLYSGNDIHFPLKIVDVARRNESFAIRELCELPFVTDDEFIDREIVLKRHFPQFDGFVCISDALMCLAKKFGSKNARYVKIPIMVDFDEYYMENRSADTECPYVFHCGTLYEQKDGILGLIEAFCKAKLKIDLPIKLFCTGNIDNSPHSFEIHKLIEKYNAYDNVVFLGYVSSYDIKKYLSGASLVVINKYLTKQNQYCFSTKLGEYLAAAKPVIITRVGEAMNYLEDGKNAIVVPPEDNEALSEAIVSAFDDLSVLNSIGIEGQEICRKNFDYKVQGDVFRKFLCSINDS